MTIPMVGNNWCADCSSPCYDHASMCTMCGSTLGPAPPPPESAPPVRSTAASLRREIELIRAPEAQAENRVSVRPIPNDAIEQLRRANEELSRLLARFRTQVDEINAEQELLRQTLTEARNDWEALPAHLLDPNQVDSANQGTSVAVLNDLPRTNLTMQSAMFYQCSITLQLPSESHQVTAMEAIPGEFGEYDRRFRSTDAILLVADPLTGKRTGLGSRDRNECKLSLLKASVQAAMKHQTRNPRPVIVYFLRGGGLSFVEKAVLAQSAGAVACLIGNHVAQPWPFTMQDSAGTAVASGLKIPTLLVSQAHGQVIQQIASALATASKGSSGMIPCNLTMEPIQHPYDEGNHNSSESPNAPPSPLSLASTDSCVVCTELYTPGHVIVTLPGCGHRFHQDCVMPWLQRHNTCPYCRHTLPLQDEQGERERLENGGGRNRDPPGASEHDFYG